MRDLKVLFAQTGGGRRFFLLLLLRAPFDILHTTLQARFLQGSFSALQHNGMGALIRACLFFGIGSLLLFLYNGSVWTLYSAATARWIGKLRRRLFGHLTGLSLAQMEAKPSGEWMTRLNADVSAATALLNQPMHLPHAACAIVNIAASSVVLLVMNPALYGLILLFVLPHLLISRLVIARPMVRLATAGQEATARNGTDLNALVTCADTALLYDAQGFLLDRFACSSKALLQANMAMRRRNALGAGLLPLMGMSGYLTALLAGGHWIANGVLTFGDLTAAFQYRGGVLVGGMMLANCLTNIQTARGGIRRVNETLQLPTEESDDGRTLDEDRRNRRALSGIGQGHPPV